MNRNFRLTSALFAVALLGGAVVANAQPRKELREDRKEHREDRQERREDRKELKEDIKDGASKKEIHEDKKELAEDRKELREDRKELREDRQAIRRNHRKELREKWGEAVVKKPGAKEELKTHGRRMARLARARKVAEELGKKELVVRIDKLMEKEKGRHQAAMEKVKEAKP
ncbi:MAG TPA: hypothetical protein PKA58_19605 [Polyangium sp.]|jgi:uncharacterized coiled-coil DUF342 family protein|nr:hypothetical protein [Polyangium sp.]